MTGGPPPPPAPPPPPPPPPLPKPPPTAAAGSSQGLECSWLESKRSRGRLCRAVLSLLSTTVGDAKSATSGTLPRPPQVLHCPSPPQYGHLSRIPAADAAGAVKIPEMGSRL